MKKSKIITVLLLINVFLIGIFVTSVDALQNNLSSNYSDMLRRPLPISDDISRFISSEKRIQNSFYQINPIPPVKPDTSTYKSLSTTTSNNSLKITSLNYTNIAKPGGLVNISFTVDGYINNTNYYIGIFDWAKGTWIKDEYQYQNGTFSKKYDWNITAPPTGQKYWLSTWYWEYSNSSWIFLDSVDIIINLMLPDLTVKDIRFSNNIALMNISNSGYTSANNISYLVFDGNPNPNYMGNNSYRKTELIHSDIIPLLNDSEFKLVKLSFPIDQNFHKAYVVVDPTDTIKETNETNNNVSKAMRLNSSRYVLDVLVVIYTNYVYNNLSISEIDFTKNQINNIFKQFYWDHTLTLSLNISYMQIDDLYNNSHLWQISPGKFWMGPWDVESDLRNRGVTDNAYDTVYVFYAWKNTNGSEAAYGGAAYGPDINWMGNTSYASEPIFCWDPNTIGEIAIHEVLHNIDGMYEVNGDSSFKSSDNMYLETTFTIPMEYYEWMLETWPTQKWFDLKWGYFLSSLGAQTISSCTNITSSGTYVLNQSIVNSGAFSCINITSSNVTFDGAGYTIDGVDAPNTSSVYVFNLSTVLTNVTVKKLTVTDWDRGIYYNNAENGSITNNIASSNNYGIFLASSGDNTIYNNYFNNTHNAFDGGINIWNTTITAGTNIVGGHNLGGNFWANPNGTGFSQTCPDADYDGICDSSYILDEYNVDCLPLAVIPNVIVDSDLEDDPANHTWNTIQAGIDNANASDVIYVRNGTYKENIAIYKPLILIGEDNNNTIIDGGNNGDVVYVKANNVQISGFKIINGKSAYPVYDVEVRGEVANGSFTWTPDNFGGFYYNVDEDIGNETLKAVVNGRDIYEGNLIYTTTPQEVSFSYSGFGKYEVMGFMGEKYFAGYTANSTPPNPTVSVGAKSTFAQGQLHKVLIDDDTKRTLSVGSTLTLKEGYVLKAKDIDVNAKTILLSLLKDGNEIDATVISAGQTYVFTKKVGIVSDLPLIMMRFDSVFVGKETQAAFLKGMFQISEVFVSIKSGTRYGMMEVVSVSKDKIVMQNDYSIYLSKDTTVDIAGNLKFKVADSDTLRFYPLVELTVPGTYEIRGKVARGTKAQTWDADSFAGFYYDLDEDIKTEKLSISGISGRTIGIENLTYQTCSAPKYFNVYKYTGILVNGQANYSVIGWQGKKYAGVNGKANKIAKVLIERGAGAAEKNTLTVGETWDMGDGWELTAMAIDAKATPRQVWFTLSYNGEKLDDKVLAQGEVYTYMEKNISNESDVPLFVTYVDSIFAGATSDMVQVRYTWLMSQDVNEIKSGDEFGKLKVVNATQEKLVLKNNYPFSINPGSIINIIGDIKFKVADSTELRYYSAVIKTIPSWEGASGIKLDDSVNIIISDVNILNSSIGIRLYSAKDNLLVKNSVSADYIGIDLTDSFQNVLSNNTILSKVYGIKPEGYDRIHFNNSIDTSNKLNGKPVYYYFNEKNITLDGIDTDHLTLAYSTGFKIRNSTIGGDGINLYYSESNLISNNTFGCAGLNSNGYGEFSGIWNYKTPDHYNKTHSIDYTHDNESLAGGILGFSDTHNKQYVEKPLLQATVPIPVQVPIGGGGGGGGKETRINLYYSNYNNITGNTLLSIVLENSYTNIVTNNNASITLYNSGSNVIDSNNAFNNSIGIYLWSSSNNSLSHNNVLNNLDKGISLYSSYNNTLSENNAVDNNWDGISLWFSSSNSLIDNNVSNNKYCGIDLYNSDNNTLTGNTMMGNTYNFAVAGEGISPYIQNIDKSNKVDGKPVYYLVNQQNRIIDSTSNAGYVGIINSTNITVKDLTLKNNSAGILFIKTNNSKIENATVLNNSAGIYLYYSYNNSISRSNESYNSGGLVLRESNYNAILNNTVFKNWRGVSIDSSSNNTIKDNYLWNNSEGILIYYWCYKCWDWADSANNLIYHNNFINNTQNAIDYSYGNKNLWNATYPIGGNYWSDYTGSDADGDGFGDTPYNISYDARDYYPLMKPLIDTTPPTVSNPNAAPHSIPDDTDNDPRWGETSQLNLTVSDESGVAAVIINLSALGKSAVQPMTRISGSNMSGVWSVITNASAGKAGSHDLTVNAMDIFGNSNTSVKISLRVLNNGDVNQDGAKTLADAMYLARYVLGKPGFENAHPGASEVSGDGSVTLADAMYLARNILNKPGFEVLH